VLWCSPQTCNVGRPAFRCSGQAPVNITEIVNMTALHGEEQTATCSPPDAVGFHTLSCLLLSSKPQTSAGNHTCSRGLVYESHSKRPTNMAPRMCAFKHHVVRSAYLVWAVCLTLSPVYVTRPNSSAGSDSCYYSAFVGTRRWKARSF
jgi:hypothetical protein